MSDNYKAVWILGMLAFPIATLFYYFAEYNGAFSIKRYRRQDYK